MKYSENKLAGAIARIDKFGFTLNKEVQEVLVSIGFVVMRDGHCNQLNTLLQALEKNRVDCKGVTTWAETFLPVVVRDGEFIINKGARKTMNVKTEEDYAQFEKEMRKGPTWFEIAKPKKAQSIFDAADYLGGAFDRIEKKLNGACEPDLAQEVREALAKIKASQAYRDAIEE